MRSFRPLSIFRHKPHARPAVKTLLASSLLALSLSGCSGQQIRYFNDEKLQAFSDQAICNDYYLFMNQPEQFGSLSLQAQQQLEARMLGSAMIEEELRAAKRGELRPGMSECALLVAWGPPNRISSTSERQGLRSRYEYVNTPQNTGPRTVVLRNSRVIGWQ